MAHAQVGRGRHLHGPPPSQTAVPPYRGRYRLTAAPPQVRGVGTAGASAPASARRSPRTSWPAVGTVPAAAGSDVTGKGQFPVTSASARRGGPGMSARPATVEAVTF